jgi:hypothetical protein
MRETGQEAVSVYQFKECQRQGGRGELTDQSAQSGRASIPVESGSLLRPKSCGVRGRVVQIVETHGRLTIASCLFEISHVGRVEVNVAQDKAALCTELEGLYYANGDDGRCPWSCKISERIVEIRHDGLRSLSVTVKCGSSNLFSGATGPGRTS